MKKYQWGKTYIDEIFKKQFRISCHIEQEKLWNMIKDYSFSCQPWSELAQKINNKTVYVPSSSQCALILDVCNKELKKLYNIKQSDRNSTIYNIQSILKDSLDFKIYRKDIYHFYESIDCHALEKEIQSNNKISFTSRKFILEFLSYCINAEAGLPRGIALSATLAEIFLLNFDKTINNNREVIFYFRYVDDILIICAKNDNNSAQSIDDLLNISLPSGLKFKINSSKNQYVELVQDAFKKDEEDKPKSIKFSYLGYEFTIRGEKDKKLNRLVCLDISPDKIKRFKTKIKKSFLNYEKNKNFDLLERRIVFLTHNYLSNKRLAGSLIKAGIYYSYLYSNPNDDGSICILDNFLKRCIWYSTLSKQQKRKLYKRTFSHGFKNKIVLKYPYPEFQEITKAWKNG